jgi:pyruvate dehydrogenase E1 component
VERAVPLVTVLDGHPHTLVFLTTIDEVPATSLGVTGFGQSGSLENRYCRRGDADSILGAGLGLVERLGRPCSRLAKR